jgi:nucleotidyltransferase/DNA polymerase involved in DNA repair
MLIQLAPGSSAVLLLISIFECRSMKSGESVGSAAKLAKIGVQTSVDLAALDPDNPRALMTKTGGRTVYELRRIACLSLELMEPTRKGIAVTRSFGAPVASWPEMREAVASYATRAAEKMCRYKVAAETSSFSSTRIRSTMITNASAWCPDLIP